MSGLSSMGEIMEGMSWPANEEPGKEIPTAEKCCNCGTIVNFAGNQWRRPCPQCGINITLSKRYKAPSKAIDCYACLDSGIIIYPAQVDGAIYEYAARCICKAGTSRTEKGIPTIDQCGNAPDYQTIAIKNKKAYQAGR